MTTLDAYATFLTARWDEVEESDLDPDWLSGSGHELRCWPHDDGEPFLCDCKKPYLRADLAAKRAILDEMGDMDDPPSWVLNLLADPFRDHPDHPANREA